MRSRSGFGSVTATLLASVMASGVATGVAPGVATTGAQAETRLAAVVSEAPGAGPAAGTHAATPGGPPPGAVSPEALEGGARRRARPPARRPGGGSGGAAGIAPTPARSAGPATTSPAAGAAGTAAGGAGTDAPRDFNSCQQFPPNKRIVKLNLKPETELGDLISWISSITCKQFVLPGTIPANSRKVTVVAPQLITPEEAYRLFLAALDSVGLTVQESGKFFRIIETVKVKSSAAVSGDAEGLTGDRYVTRLVRVENADVNELSGVLNRLKTEQGDVVVYPPQGTLIITDTGSSVARMLKIVEELDQAGQGERVWIVRMKNTAASEMATKLAEIFRVEQLGGKRGAGAPPPPAPQGQAPTAAKGRATANMAAEMTITKIIPDERSNQLIILANERAYARALVLIRKLDVPIEGGDGRMHIYYCENANCDELAQTVGAITGVPVSGGGAASRSRGGAAQPAPAAPAASPTTPGQAPLLFEGEVKVSFDRPTNSLIVLSSLKDYQALRRVIERLDSPRKQIFVEAIIMEVALDKTRTLGASFHGGIPEVPIFGKQSLILGGLDAGKTLFPSSLLAGDTLLGLAAAAIGPPIPNSGRALAGPTSTAVDLPAFGVLLRALQQNNDVNVLSTPHLLIMNNEDGEISVGQNLPFPGASFGGTGGLPAGGAPGGFPFGGFGFATPVQRTDVALKMKLTPHVNEHDMIRLDVDQEIQDILSPNFNNLGPATSKRSAKTTVVAKDQQTIVIGGLMSDRVVDRVSKIPILGDVPILGFFFRNSTKTIQKTNILIALTPYVVSDQADLRRILEKKLKERREFVDRFGKQDVVNPEASIDYRRKRGMLEEINRAGREIEEEEAEMQRIRERDAIDEAGPVDMPTGGQPTGGGGTAPVGGSGTTPAGRGGTTPSDL